MKHWPGNARNEQTSFGALNRSELMTRVRSYGNKTTEAKMTELLRAAGLKGWRRHLPMPGRPDFAWRKEHVALFVDGCFWHGHSCGKNITPKTNAALWAKKIEANRLRDRGVTRKLRSAGWTVVRLWECSINRSPDQCVMRLAKLLNLPASAI